ncbi:hypothetical protein HELRODRAFT_172013 [Helobdella robusta]|uniref:J domain-containing protein n=1 Tax=Helobdella robusta TaxID=6412 RepID=T1F4X9_HELRO|nr:hypothetical protein HELRODRAFT_172013 [Helobdella robusta]ESO05001.1 hypothetical protein HELRODRAFT_172013 [Helobdella robusta]
MAAKKSPLKVLAALVHNETENLLPLTFYSMEGIPYRKRFFVEFSQYNDSNLPLKVTLKPKYQGLITSLVLFKVEFEDHNPFTVEKWLEIFIIPDPSEEFSVLIKGGAISMDIRESVLDYVMINNHLRLLHLDTKVLELPNKPKSLSPNVVTKQPTSFSKITNLSMETLNAPSFLNLQYNNQETGDWKNTSDFDEEVTIWKNNFYKIWYIVNTFYIFFVCFKADKKSNYRVTIEENISSSSNKNYLQNASSDIFVDALSKNKYIERYIKKKVRSSKNSSGRNLIESFSNTKWADEEVRNAYNYMKNELTRRPYKNAIKRVMHHKFRHAYEVLADEQRRYLYKRFIYSSWKRIKFTKFFCCTDKKCSRQFHSLFFIIMIINVVAQIYFFAEASKKRLYNFTWRSIFESTAVLFASLNDFLLSSTADYPYEEKIMCCVYPECNCFFLNPPTFIPFLFISLLFDLLCGTGMSLVTVDLYDVLDNKYRLPLILVDAICSTLMITLIGVINDLKKKIVAEAFLGRLYPSITLCIAVFRNLTETMVSVVAFGAFGGTICGLIKSKINLEETGLDEFFFYYFQMSNASLKIVKMFASAIRGLCRQLGHVIKRTMETRYERELPAFSQIQLRKRTSLVEKTDELTRLRDNSIDRTAVVRPVIINIAGPHYADHKSLNTAGSNSSERVDNETTDLIDDEDWMFYEEGDHNEDENVTSPASENTNANKLVEGSKLNSYYVSKDDFNFITFDNKSGFLTVVIVSGEEMARPIVLEDLESITIPKSINNVKLHFRTLRIIPHCVPYFCKCPCNLNRPICNGCLGCCFRLRLTNMFCDWPYHLCWKTLPEWNREIDYGPSCARCLKRFNIFCCIYPGRGYEVKHTSQRVYVVHTLCTKRSLIEERDIFEEVIVV